jgi:hypothetical protein
MEVGLEGRPVDAEADGYVPDGYGGQNAIRVVGRSDTRRIDGEYGYRIDGDDVVFELDLADCDAITTSDGTALDIGSVSLGTVAVAGEFNGWSTVAWPMDAASSGLYELRRPKSDLGPGTRWLFKFVADGSHWIEPPRGATNVSPVGEGALSSNLVLYTGEGRALLERLALPASKQGDRCRLKPLSHGRGASLIPMSSNPMTTTDRDVIGTLMMFVMPPTAAEEAAYEEEISKTAPERARARIQEIMRERAAQVSAGFVAVYEPSPGAPETGMYALLFERPIPDETRAELEQDGPSGFLMFEGRVAVMAWSDGSDRSCLEAVRSHVEDILSGQQ